jgi:predicted DNA-binding transcriptional regulator AlpA
MKIISRREARKRVGDISRTTEHRKARNDPTWPLPVQISPGLTGYIEAEIERWIQARAAERGQELRPAEPEEPEDAEVPPPTARRSADAQPAAPQAPPHRKRGRPRGHARSARRSGLRPDRQPQSLT